ncbi:hypothetical protein D3C87_176590 [compost metagenome]
MNLDMFQGKFKEVSGEIKKKWGSLTDDEIMKTKGNMEALTGLVQQKLGISKEEASKQVSETMKSLEEKYGQSFSDKVNQKIDEIKNKFSH